MDFNMSELIAMNQKWSDRGCFTMSRPRPTNALLLFCGCRGTYEGSDGTVIEVPKGSLFYIPANSTYRWTFTENEEISTMLFEFVLNDAAGDRIQVGNCAGIINSGRFELYKDLFRSLVFEFSRPVRTYARVRAAAYSLMAEISGEDRKNYNIRGNIRCIYKGIKYLEEDPQQDKSIREIADMCNVSVNYFERLFRDYAGCTPTQYRIQRKIENAKLLLRNDVLTVQQISYELNFEDPAYFCRIFKKLCGYTPLEYRSYYKKQQ